MSATMARQGGQVQLEQSNMCLAFNMAKMVKEGCSHASIEETKNLMMNPRAEVHEARKQWAEFPGTREMNAAIERHPALVLDNLTDGYHPRRNCTQHTPRTCSGHRGTCAPPPEPMPSPPEKPSVRPAPPGEIVGAQSSEIRGEPPASTENISDRA